MALFDEDLREGPTALLPVKKRAFKLTPGQKLALERHIAEQAIVGRHAPHYSDARRGSE
jgi:hypothetical protein